MFTIKLISNESTTLLEWPSVTCIEPRQKQFQESLGELYLELMEEGWRPEEGRENSLDSLPFQPIAVLKCPDDAIYVKEGEEAYITNESGKTVFSIR